MLTGAGHQARREIDRWGSGGRWLRRMVVWTLALAGLAVAMLWVLPGVVAEPGVDEPVDVLASSAQWVEFAALILAVGATIGSQGVLLDDRRSGVLEWVLSKPLTRSGLVVAMYAAQVLGTVLVTMLVPWVAVWGVFSIAYGGPWPVGWFFGALAAVTLLILFQIALVLALSAFTWSRGVVLGVALAMLVGSDLLTAAVPSIASFNPFLLGRAAGGLAQGAGFGEGTQAIAAVTLGVVLVVATCVRLERTEL